MIGFIPFLRASRKPFCPGTRFLHQHAIYPYPLHQILYPSDFNLGDGQQQYDNGRLWCSVTCKGEATRPTYEHVPTSVPSGNIRVPVITTRIRPTPRPASTTIIFVSSPSFPRRSGEEGRGMRHTYAPCSESGKCQRVLRARKRGRDGGAACDSVGMVHVVRTRGTQWEGERKGYAPSLHTLT